MWTDDSITWAWLGIEEVPESIKRYTMLCIPYGYLMIFLKTQRWSRVLAFETIFNSFVQSQIDKVNFAVS